MHLERSILIVDRDAVTRILIKWYLGIMGYDVASTFSAGEALRLLKQHQYRFLLTDLAESGTGGESFARLVRARFPYVHLILRSHKPPENPDLFDLIIEPSTHMMRLWELLEARRQHPDLPASKLTPQLPLHLKSLIKPQLPPARISEMQKKK